MGQLKIGNKDITYEEKYSTRARHLRLTINKGQVRVTIPWGVSGEIVTSFVESKKEWIFKHVQNYKEAALPNKEYADGEKFFYMGKELILRTETQSGKYTTIQLESNAVRVFIPDEIPKAAWPEVVRDSLSYAFKNQAKKIFKDKLNHYSKIMGLQYNEMRIKEQRTKWGSCSRRGNINFNWRVIMAPNEVIDYLVIHELAHLKHLNHSKAFWHYVASFMPRYKEWQKWLKENGKKLVL